MSEAPGAPSAGPWPGTLPFAALGALQGLAAYALWETWPETGTAAFPLAVGAAYAIVASGLVLHLAGSGTSRGRLALLASGTGFVFGGIALWVAHQLPGANAQYFGDQDRVRTWLPAAGIALFVLGPFLQIHQASGTLRFPYSELYLRSWRNFFITALGAGMTGALWVVLRLWGALFDLVGIGLFEQIFARPLFYFPVTGAAFGYALAVVRGRSAVVDALVGITQALFRALLTLTAFVSLLFLGSLPFTGLAPLFATSHAAALLIAWLAVVVLFFNAVYLDGGSAPPYGRWLRMLCEAGVLAGVALGAIALYALWLRIAQYGLTPQRCWAVLAAVVLSLYAIGYSIAVIRRGAPWLPVVRRVNVAMALVVIALALGTHTSLGDPVRWSVRDQLARLASGRVAPDAFDYDHLRFGLGHVGYEALQQLQRDLPATGPDDARRRLADALDPKRSWYFEAPSRKPEPSDFVLPASGDWPAGLLEALRAHQSQLGWLEQCAIWPCPLFPLDLEGDGTSEQVVVFGDHAAAFARTAQGGWGLTARTRESQRPPDARADMTRASARPVRAYDLEIGEGRLLLVSEQDGAVGSP